MHDRTRRATAASPASAPGNYWVVETTTPAGYDTAPDQAVVVGIGAVGGRRATATTLEFADPVVNGKVSITKTDDADNALAGAEFTLYADNAPTGGSRGAEDTIITTKTCTTAADGKCDITDVPPGDYWVVETKTPDHYDTAADKAITVGLGSAAHRATRSPCRSSTAASTGSSCSSATRARTRCSRATSRSTASRSSR